ncbi:histidinol-phosphatase [Fictibacillus macauensis ZFHKF-1]|uniref:Histidinol-phosphatase n=1 Tax=Fictibacillus macauensis ZFHKF-1 TaxID=1196324 RepID=I8UFA1_9BACL|nr:histidinol-phosphatase HisJ [Fictibacillus macauensis]EIT85473.1 histidinol-phosphatase [Fictibacillus macauensis ZFHKF-1]
MKPTYDGHVHTAFCPHGSTDRLVDYVERALKLGYTGISFTEHAPLPEGFVDPAPSQDSAMKREFLPLYLEEVAKVKTYYQSALQISIGLEVDYIDGWESETTAFLNEVGPKLDDSILSVHFLALHQAYYCLDYSAEEFQHIVEQFGSLAFVYDAYFATVSRSITSNLGPYKPKRYGHISLIHKFQKKFPSPRSYEKEFLTLLQLVKTRGEELDYNGAGSTKPYCQETYPPQWVAKEAAKQKIPLIYGSDAHSFKGLHQGSDQLSPCISLSIPQTLQRQ